jgi:hypothetical protein
LWSGAVEMLMRQAAITGITGRPKWRHAKPDNIATDLAGRYFARAGHDQHPQRQPGNAARPGHVADPGVIAPALDRFVSDDATESSGAPKAAGTDQPGAAALCPGSANANRRPCQTW